MPHNPRSDLDALLVEVLAMPEPERAAFLNRVGRDDDDLRHELDGLLDVHARAGDFLERPAVRLPSLDGPLRGEGPGSRIGPYTIVERIGEGGFGVVYEAEQSGAVQRRVALKIIKLGMDTERVIARFETERQALAVMDHPNIARVFDAGSTESGRPYFVMEYVEGVGLVQHCDTEKLDTAARLGLFIDVCHAIQHAHQKGIIHRDIKPGNVLVSMHDGRPVPKVIDFGIAKATDTDSTRQTLFTEHRQLVGTPAYMSPEQAEMGALDVDTRSDVYALGVLLYELLTGTTPFDTHALHEEGFAAMMRVIREREPVKPSTRVAADTEAAVRAAERRCADVRKLSTLVRGDLDWIVMKCLEKDRTRRYETANGLAADIERHLNDDPVLALPPSPVYRMRKFIRRNRGAVAAVAAVFMALALGIVGTTFGLVRATAEAERAEQALARANEAKGLIIDMFKGVTPEEAQREDTTLLKRILDATAADLLEGSVADELVAADLHHVLGFAYWSLGRAGDAERHLPAAVEIRSRRLGETAPETLTSMHVRAMVLLDLGRFDEAESLRLATLDLQRRTLGDEHPDTLNSMNSLGVLHRRRGRLDEAESLFDTVHDASRRVLGASHEDTLRYMSNLAILYRLQGRDREAEALHRSVLEGRRRLFGDDHPQTLKSMASLTVIYTRSGRHAEAEGILLEIVDARSAMLGEEHPETLDTVHNLAELYRLTGRYDEGERLHLETLGRRRHVLPADHPDALKSLSSLGQLYKESGRYAEAESMYVETLAARRRTLGDEHRSTLGTLTNLGILYNAMGRFDDARAMLETSLPVKRRLLGVQHGWTSMAMNELAEAYVGLSRPDDALALYRELRDLRLRQTDAPDVSARDLNSAAWLLLAHDFEELRDPVRALPLAERACATEEANGGGRLWMYLDSLALAQHLTGDSASAVGTVRRALDLLPETAEPLTRAELEQRLATYAAVVRGVSAGDDRDG